MGHGWVAARRGPVAGCRRWVADAVAGSRGLSPMGRGRVAARRGPVASSVGVSSVLGGGSGGFVVHPPLRYHVRLAASGRRRLVQTGGSELCLSSASAPQRVEEFGGVSDVSDVSDVSGVGTVGTVGTVGVSLTVHAHGHCREIYYSLSGAVGLLSGLSGVGAVGTVERLSGSCRVRVSEWSGQGSGKS